MRPAARIAVSLACLAVGLTSAEAARADATAWAFLGGGGVAWKQPPHQAPGQPPGPVTSSTQPDLGLQGAMNIDVGVGSSAENPFILGSLFRLMPVIGHGTDLAILGRLTTRHFQSGDFGLALDAGAYGRFWGERSSGFLGEFVLGGPLGLELRLFGSKGTNDAVAFGAVAGVDLLRLTVYRGSLLNWWQNPGPKLRQASSGFALPF